MSTDGSGVTKEIYFTKTGDCPISIGYTFSGISGGNSACYSLFGNPNGNIPSVRFGATTDQTCIGTYTISVHYEDRTVNPCILSAPFTATFDYVLIAVDPCTTTTFVSTSFTATNPFFTKAIGTGYSQTEPTVLFATTATGCALTNTFSTSPSYSKLTATVGSDGKATISMASSTVSSEQGTYTIIINSCITLKPAECKSVPFTVQLALPCENTVVTASTYSDVSIDLWDYTEISFIEFSDYDPATGLTNGCPLTYSANVGGGPLP